MRLLYTFGILLYGIGIRIWAFRSAKAKKWVNGRKHLFRELQKKRTAPKSIWFHCASLGEFEQGRPVLEALHHSHPNARIVLSFFSPSGYEVRKNYALADVVCYMPLDTPGRAGRFIELVNPAMAVFVKYEIWHNHLLALSRRSIPVYLISAKFRKDQIYFRPYGKWFTRSLHCMAHIFVQDEESLRLAKDLKLQNVSISGDTRFDRVWQLAQQPRNLPQIRAFAGSYPVLVAGSTWPADEDLLVRYINNCTEPARFILAPHEVDPGHLQNLRYKISRPSAYFSAPESDPHAEVLIVDTIGHLSRIYAYGQAAYIGGGFGAGIHNVLEPAAYGLPVVFGPRFSKFKEATDLIRLQAASAVDGYAALKQALDGYLFSPKGTVTGGKAAEYVANNKGATDRIKEMITRKNDIF